MREISISRIKPNPNQPRRNFPEEELGELADSIREHGILQPLLIQAGSGGGYELVSGERRLRAAEIAGLSTVPSIIVDPQKPGGSLTIALVENVQRTDLNAIELARAYKRLQEEFGRTQEEIAKMVGKSRSQVTNTLRLLELPDDIQAAIGEGSITAGHARALLAAPKDARIIIYEHIIKNSLNVRQAEKAAKSAARTVKTPHPPGVIVTLDPSIGLVLRDMELALETALGRKVSIIRKRGGRGRMTLDFYSDRDLETLVEKLRRQN